MLKIFLVDDSEIDCFITQRLFSHVNLPIEFLAMTNTEKALTYLCEKASSGTDIPDIILVDLYMAPVDGAEFLKTLHTLTQGNFRAYIVVISSSTNLPVTTLREFGVCDFIHKPLSIDKIVGFLENYAPNYMLENINYKNAEK